MHNLETLDEQENVRKECAWEPESKKEIRQKPVMKSGSTVLKKTEEGTNRRRRSGKEKKGGVRLKWRRENISQGGMSREKHV